MQRDRRLPLTETTYYIMLALLEPAHGYLIMQKVEKLSNNQVKLAAGTLYGAIENLLKQRFIRLIESENKRRKTYIITNEGKEVLLADYERMQYMVQLTKHTLSSSE